MGGGQPCVPVVSVAGGGGGGGAGCAGGGASLLRSRRGSLVVERAGGGAALLSVAVESTGTLSDAVAVRAGSSDVEVVAVVAAVCGRGRRVMRIRPGSGNAAVDVPVAVAAAGSVPATEPGAVDVPIGAGLPRVKLVVVSTPVSVTGAVVVVAVPSPMLEVAVPLAPSWTTSYCCC